MVLTNGPSIVNKQIDSFPKLRFLLFLRQNPYLNGNTQNLAEKLYIEAPLVEKLIHDFQQVGLLEVGQGNYCYRLSNEPDLKTWLEKLAAMFDQPVARQELLARVRKPRRTHSTYPESHKASSRMEQMVPLK